jgi:hypothetical protein
LVRSAAALSAEEGERRQRQLKGKHVFKLDAERCLCNVGEAIEKCLVNKATTYMNGRERECQIAKNAFDQSEPVADFGQAALCENALGAAFLSGGYTRARVGRPWQADHSYPVSRVLYAAALKL